MLKVISTEKAPAAVGPYSQAIQAGQFIYVSGQLPLIPGKGELVKDDIKAATRQALENAKAILESAGASVNDVVKVPVLLNDIIRFSEMNRVCAE